MENKFILTGIIAASVLCVMICPVAAADAISTIHSGNTVFIGEQGLDITAAMEGDTVLGWWASGAAIASSSPDYTISVANPASFSVYPGDFQTHLGNWYHLSSLSKANGTAFIVADPQLQIRVEDTTVNVDVTDKWVPTDDDLQFRIDSNLLQMIQRTGVTSVPITIRVQTPEGTTLTSLTSRNGAITQIDPYPVTSNPQYTGAIWGTSNRQTYSPGTYQIWAECNVNSMKDNYAQVGKTMSQQVSMLNQNQNPVINNKAYVTNPTTSVTTLIPKTTTPPVTAIPTPIITTTQPTIPLPELTQIPQTTLVTETTAIPSSTSKKTPGFGIVLAITALIFGLLLSFRNN